MCGRAASAAGSLIALIPAMVTMNKGSRMSDEKKKTPPGAPSREPVREPQREKPVKKDPVPPEKKEPRQ